MFGESKIIIISPLLSRRLLVTDKAIDGPQSRAGAVHILILEKLIQTETLLFYLGLCLKTDKAVLLSLLEQTNRGLVLLQVSRYSAAFLAPDLLECVPCQWFCWRHVQ